MTCDPGFESCAAGCCRRATVLALGEAHTCAITPSRSVKCWGDNEWGQLGNNSTVGSSVAQSVVGLEPDIVAVTAGAGHTCALSATGSVQCWGRSDHFELGDGTSTRSLVPVKVGGLGANVAGLTAGDSHTCALKEDGSVACWGDNHAYQLGSEADVSSSAAPLDVSDRLPGTVVGLRAHASATCALTAAGAVSCWGVNLAIALASATPRPVAGLGQGIRAVTLGRQQACVLAGISVSCWGDGPLGDNQFVGSLTPVAVVGLREAPRTLVSGDRHTCLLTTTGAVTCWGSNDRGQLGTGSTTTALVPTDVRGLGGGVTAIGAGPSHSCAATTAAGIMCWGYNASGQLGRGAKSPLAETSPVSVSGF